MAKFDIYVNPNKAATHHLYVDVQSDFVRLSTRWCIPLYRYLPPRPIIQGAQALIEVDRQQYVMDVPNLLAVPASLLRQQVGRLSSSDQLVAESCIEFMLRGY
ncbi:MAG TPA: CcdB family protein [Burkholderiaceae bacterium]|nr:CcdB family protein [Burkholderiaceae bacterium]